MIWYIQFHGKIFLCERKVNTETNRPNDSFPGNE